MPPRFGRFMGLGGSMRCTLDGAVLLDIEVQPGANHQGIQSFNEWRNRLRVAVRAQAQHGLANHAVLSLLATQLGCPLTDLSIVAGQRSHHKTVRFETEDIDGLVERFVQLLGGLRGKP